MNYKKIIKIVILLVVVFNSSAQLPEYFRLSNPIILKDRIACEGRVWNTQNKSIILSTEHKISLALNSIYYNDGTNTMICNREDGRLIATLPGINYNYDHLSLYYWVFNGAVFSAYSEAGQLISTKNVDGSNVFPYSSEIRYIKGNSLYKYVYSSTNADLMGTFQGTFSSWFMDGEHFLTVQSTIVRVYNKSCEQVKIVDLPTISNLGGSGKYFWVWDSPTAANPIYVYRTDNNTVATYPTGTSAKVFKCFNSIGILPYSDSEFSIIRFDESGSTISKYKGSGTYLNYFNSDMEGNWTTCNRDGLVNYGNLNNEPSLLNLGALTSLYGNRNGYFAFSTVSGNTFVGHLNGSQAEITDTVGIKARKVSLSLSGSYLAAAGDSLCVFDLSSGLEILPGNYDPADFDFSEDGSLIAFHQANENYLLNVSNGQTTYLEGNSTTTSAPKISPTKEYVFTINVTGPGTAISKLYKNGILYNAFDGPFGGWIDNNKFFIYTTAYNTDGQIQSGYTIPSYVGFADKISETEYKFYEVLYYSICDISNGKILYNTEKMDSPYSVPSTCILGTDHLLLVKNNKLEVFNWRQYSGNTTQRIEDTGYHLGQNYPNPCSINTTIDYKLPDSKTGELLIFNSTGMLIQKQYVTGNGWIELNIADYNPGLYIYQLISERQTISKKLIVIK